MRLLFAIALLTLPLQAGVISGCVRDANKNPVPGVEVYLNGRPAPVSTDAQGNYRFEKLARGTYSIRAAASGRSAASLPFSLDEKETRQVDMVLQPEFFDEPKFVVAGVTAGNYQGGHGSDVVLRSSDALTKELRAKAAPAESAASLRQAIARDPNNADLHHRLGDADETSGNPLEAVREYQRAAELAPTEPYLFDFGTELLSHRADTQATEVFTKANRLHPESVRILLGLATAWYASGAYDKAASSFFAACDLNPQNPAPYLLLGKVRAASITQSPGFAARMEQFARFHPEDAQANYLYAAALWSNRTGNDDAPKVERFLQKSIQLDPNLSESYLTLGIVYSDLKQFPRAIENLQKAVPLEEAHYRLSQAYRLTGQTDQAQKELIAYKQLSAKSAEQAQRERRELQQFVFSLRTQ